MSTLPRHLNPAMNNNHNTRAVKYTKLQLKIMDKILQHMK